MKFKKLLMHTFCALSLCCCANSQVLIYPNSETFATISSEDKLKISDSYEKLLKGTHPEVKTWFIDLSCHICTVNEHISIDVLHSTCSECSVPEVVTDITLNEEYICSVANADYEMIVCDLSKEQSYYLQTAYNENVITNNDVNTIIKMCKNIGK